MPVPSGHERVADVTVRVPGVEVAVRAVGADQWVCPSFPAELTQRIPLARASATIARSDRFRRCGKALPPREWLITWTPWLFAYVSAAARSTSVPTQRR